MAKVNFKGKEIVRNHHLTIPYHELVPDAKRSLMKKVSLNDKENIILNPKTTSRLKPPIRWAGGKYRLVPKLIDHLPSQFNKFIEPMAGSAALFFTVQPERAILADINSELINFYKILAFKTDSLIEALMEIKASKFTYYEYRDSKPKTDFERAIKFCYLNRLCWNGVYRVNSTGNFNVPIGDRLPKDPWSSDHLEKCAAVLRGSIFM